MFFHVAHVERLASATPDVTWGHWAWMVVVTVAVAVMVGACTPEKLQPVKSGLVAGGMVLFTMLLLGVGLPLLVAV